MLEWQEPNSLVGDAEMLLIHKVLFQQTRSPVVSMQDCKTEAAATETI